MKKVSAREGKNRFGQLLDDAQREPVTIEKNGRPFAVVQSYASFQETQRLKLEALRDGVIEARAHLARGRGKSFDRSAVEDIKSVGRRKLADRE